MNDEQWQELKKMLEQKQPQIVYVPVPYPVYPYHYQPYWISPTWPGWHVGPYYGLTVTCGSFGNTA